MPPELQLVWNNPRIESKRRHDLMLLRLLGDFLAGASRCGYVEGAQQLAANHDLTPLAAAVVSKQMRSAGICEDVIRKIV
jgi:hypothetical protein